MSECTDIGFLLPPFFRACGEINPTQALLLELAPDSYNDTKHPRVEGLGTPCRGSWSDRQGLSPSVGVKVAGNSCEKYMS